MKQKETFKKLFTGIAIFVAVLPFMVTFSAVLSFLF